MTVQLLKLFYIFFKTGLFTVGGGLATLPLLQDQLVHTGMLDQHEFINMIAIAQSTPGPIGINMATYAGFKTAGIAGAIAATVGIVAPSLLVILSIAIFMKGWRKHPLVKHILAALRPTAAGLIGAAALFIFTKSLFMFDHSGKFDFTALLLLLPLAAFYSRFKPHPVIIIAIGGIVGTFVF